MRTSEKIGHALTGAGSILFLHPLVQPLSAADRATAARQREAARQRRRLKMLDVRRKRPLEVVADTEAVRPGDAPPPCGYIVMKKYFIVAAIERSVAGDAK